MNSLVRLLSIPLCCVASTENGQICIREVEVHQILDRQFLISHEETTLEWIHIILNTMGCKMKNSSLWQLLLKSLGLSTLHDHHVGWVWQEGVFTTQEVLNDGDLLDCSRKVTCTRVGCVFN